MPAMDISNGSEEIRNLATKIDIVATRALRFSLLRTDSRQKE